MKLYRGVKQLIRDIERIKNRRRTIGFIPTMGALHEGHLSLIRKARKDTNYVVVSIFVNPIQFGQGEDFTRYPKNLKKDLDLCRKEGVDIVFAPSQKTMYPSSFYTYVTVEKLTETLCGASRPIHFKGVTTIVAKLFNIVQPDAAYFGQKDVQQAIVIRKMVNDLNMPVKINILPIVRGKDGLAMSSRNIYLSKDERTHALSIYRSLKLAKDLYRNGERAPNKIIAKMREDVLKEKAVKIEYISIVDPDTLRKVDKAYKKVLAAVAVKIGKTRLIDNVIM